MPSNTDLLAPETGITESLEDQEKSAELDRKLNSAVSVVTTAGTSISLIVLGGSGIAHYMPGMLWGTFFTGGLFVATQGLLRNHAEACGRLAQVRAVRQVVKTRRNKKMPAKFSPGSL